MVCSPEQLASNRRNSKRSTGPKTPEGRAISRRNGLKHGLTGAGVVIADEDVAAVEERFEAFQVDLKPANDVALFLTRRAALLSVRLDRSAREEASRITRDMLLADDAEEDARVLEFERLTSGFADHPAESVRKLRRSEEGIDWLLDARRSARRDLLERDGMRWKIETMIRLSGLEEGSVRGRRLKALNLAMHGGFQWLEASDWPDLPPLERKAVAKAEILTLIDREIAGLEEAHKGLDRDRIAQVRAGAAERAIFNADRDSTLARKYEANAERGFFRTLKKIEEINASVAEEESTKVEVEESPEEEETCGEMASSLPAEKGRESRFEMPPVSSRQEAVASGHRPEVSDQKDRRR